MRVLHISVLRLSCLSCLIFSPLVRATASGPRDAGGKSPVKAASAGPDAVKLPATLVKAQTRRLGVQSRIDAQPLVFFPVPGENKDVRFMAARPGYSITLGDSSLTLISHQQIAPAPPAKKPEAATGLGPVVQPGRELTKSVKVDFLGSDPKAQIEGQGEASGYANFFTGNDASKWQRHVSGYQRVRYSHLYPGIDLIYYGQNERRLEYDLVVAPGADPNQIRLHVSGNQTAQIGPEGDLQLDGPSGVMRLDTPALYQSSDHEKRMIAGRFVQLAKNEFGFSTAGYDKAKPLVIDPKINLVYATYAGGIHNDQATDLVLDANGAAYVTGYTASQDFPVSANAIQTARKNIGTYTYDAFLLKFDASGTLIFSTFLGGNDTDQARAVQLDASGNILIAGYTQSSDFPITANAYQPAFGGGTDAFLSKVSNDGSQLIYSTYLGGGGSEAINRMRVLPDGSIYAVGDASADGLPFSATAVQKQTLSSADGFTAKFLFDANGSLQIPALTFMGGTNPNGETGLTSDLDFDAAGNVYVTGATQSSDYPVTANAFEKNFPLSGGCYNSPTPNEAIFITKYTPDLSQMPYSTIVGGKTEDQNGYPVCNQYGKTIHIDQATGNIWVVGSTGMSDFPVTANAISKMLNTNGTAGVDSFVFELSADGQTQLYGTYLGGSQFDYGGAAAWDAANNIWIAGPTQSTDYPVTSDALQPANAGSYDTFVTELSPDASTILYATYLGGSGDDDISSANRIRLDAGGNIHLAGGTSSVNYPVTASASQMLYANGDQGADTADAYYTILGTGAIGTVGPAIGGDAGDTTVTITGAGFTAGATCSLNLNGTIILATSVTLNPGGTQLSCTFALTGAATGAYDVQVTNADGTTFTKPAAFTVASGGGPNLSVAIIGRPLIRTGVATTFNIVVSNTGNADAYVVPLFISVPASLTFSVNGLSAAQSAAISQTVGDTTYINLFGSDLAAGKSTTIPLQLTAATDMPHFSIGAALQPPWFGNAADLLAAGDGSNYSPGCVASTTNSFAMNCEGTYLALRSLGQVPLASVSGQQSMFQSPLVTARSAIVHPLVDPCKAANSYQDGQDAGKKAAMMSLKDISYMPFNPAGAPNGNPNMAGTPDYYLWNAGFYYGYTIGVVTGITGGGGSARGGVHANADACMLPPPTPPPPPPSMPPPSSGGSGSGSSIDPNYKTGPSGDGTAAHFTRATAALSYQVGFENEATATLPAAAVVVTDQLDPAKVDLTTFTLGTIAFGTNVITPPTGLTSYSTTYTPPGVTNYVVRIQGSLDLASAMARWTFQTIDPSTGQPPTDPSVGFLPPDTDGTVGQGSVLFNVMPKTGQTTGTVITNTANIIFDANPAILTPTWTNTLDVDLPHSTVAALAPKVVAGDFTVSWSGTDVGSGIGTYTVYVSDNGAPYTVFAQAVTATSGTYTGVAGHTYTFYSIATDAAGNMEPAKTTPDATTSSVVSLTPLVSTTTLAASATSIANGSSITFTAKVIPPTGTTTLPTGTVMFLNGTTVLGTVTLDATATATFPTTALPTGTDSITAQYSGDPDFAPSTSAATTITVAAPIPLISTTTLTASATDVTPGGSITLTAVVGPPAGTTTIPTGSVSFLNGTTSLGTITLDATGTAVFTTTALPTGTDSITAQYTGDMAFAGSTSAAIAVTVGTPMVTLSLSPSTLTVSSGSTVTSTLTIASVAGFSAATNLTCSGLPSASSCSFSPATVTPAADGTVTSTLTISTTTRSAAFALPALGNSSKLAYGLLLPILLTPLAFIGGRRRKTIAAIGCRLTLLFAATGLFLVASGCGGHSSTTTTTSPTGTQAGTYTVNIIATSGTQTQTTALTLTVQ